MGFTKLVRNLAMATRKVLVTRLAASDVDLPIVDPGPSTRENTLGKGSKTSGTTEHYAFVQRWNNLDHWREYGRGCLTKPGYAPRSLAACANLCRSEDPRARTWAAPV